jgi:hypothetical protein
MIGQDLPIDKVARVIVLVLNTDGTQVGWEVTHPTLLSWTYDGMHDIHGTKAMVTVAGVFHRKGRDAVLIELQDGTTRMIEP